MTRDELVQAAIEALDADNPGSTYIDTEIDVVDGSLTDVVRAVVDTVLAKLAEDASVRPSALSAPSTAEFLHEPLSAVDTIAELKARGRWVDD